MKKYKVTFEFEVDAAHGEKAALAAAHEIYRQQITDTTLLEEKESEDKPGLFRSIIKKIMA